MSQLVYLTRENTVARPRENTSEQTMSSAKYEKKPRCAGGCKETESFVAKSGDTFNKCKDCGNLVHQRLKCGHKNTENATSQSQANNGRSYIRCADPGCRQFLHWETPATSTGSTTATQSFTYATRESVDALTQALTILVGRVAALEAAGQEQVGNKRARTENKE